MPKGRGAKKKGRVRHAKYQPNRPLGPTEFYESFVDRLSGERKESLLKIIACLKREDERGARVHRNHLDSLLDGR